MDVLNKKALISHLIVVDPIDAEAKSWEIRKLYNESSLEDRAKIIQAIDRASKKIQINGHTFVAAIYRQAFQEIVEN
jgi:hypothetical protein